MAGAPHAGAEPLHLEDGGRIVYQTGWTEPVAQADHSRELRPGQRHPTEAERKEAFFDLLREGEGLRRFPEAPQFLVTKERLIKWYTHGWMGLRGDSAYLRRQGDLSSDELALFLWDLCYLEGVAAPHLEARIAGAKACSSCGAAAAVHVQACDACGAVFPADAFECFRDGRTFRDGWGVEAPDEEILAALDRKGPSEEAAAGLPAHLTGVGVIAEDLRDWAILLLLDEHLFRPRDLAVLTIGDVDVDTCSLRIAGEWEGIGPATMFAVEAYLDTRPELDPAAPLFHGRRGPLRRPAAIREAADAARRELGQARRERARTELDALAEEEELIRRACAGDEEAGEALGALWARQDQDDANV